MKLLYKLAPIILTLSACAHESLEGHYSCSYETTTEGYKNCMLIAREAQKETAEKASQ